MANTKCWYRIYHTFSRSILSAGKFFPTKAITGLPKRSCPVLYKHRNEAISVKSSVLALFSNLSYLNIQQKQHKVSKLSFLIFHHTILTFNDLERDSF